MAEIILPDLILGHHAQGDMDGVEAAKEYSYLISQLFILQLIRMIRCWKSKDNRALCIHCKTFKNQRPSFQHRDGPGRNGVKKEINKKKASLEGNS